MVMVHTRWTAPIDDGDNNIYVLGEDGKQTGEVIGRTLTATSFLNEDGSAAKGAIINPGDNSGNDFLNNEIVGDEPNLLVYMARALPQNSLDFKDRGFTGDRDAWAYNDHIMRGMPLGGVKNLPDEKSPVLTFSSAREIGNIAAGYIAGIKGFSWESSRDAFDALEGGSEPFPTQNGQHLGFKVGSAIFESREAARAKKIQQNFRLVPFGPK